MTQPRNSILRGNIQQAAGERRRAASAGCRLYVGWFRAVFRVLSEGCVHTNVEALYCAEDMEHGWRSETDGRG